MATLSYFQAEKNVSLHDREFYEYLRGIARYQSPAAMVVEWIDTAANPVSYDWWNPRGRWRKQVDGDQMRFSFACFNACRIVGYTFRDFWKLIRAMERFLKKPASGSTGFARFRCEGSGRTFDFRLDYAKRKITMTGEASDYNRRYKHLTAAIPSRILAGLGKPLPPRVPPVRTFEWWSKDDLYQTPGKPRNRRYQRISMKGSSVTIESCRSKSPKRVQVKEFGTPAAARAIFYKSITGARKTGYSEFQANRWASKIATR
jgi:hypothetical protein